MLADHRLDVSLKILLGFWLNKSQIAWVLALWGVAHPFVH